MIRELEKNKEFLDEIARKISNYIAGHKDIEWRQELYNGIKTEIVIFERKRLFGLIKQKVLMIQVVKIGNMINFTTNNEKIAIIVTDVSIKYGIDFIRQ